MTNLEISAFLAICQHGTISKAAENLYISQSALSTRLKTLERELGCTLLLRCKGRHSLDLTQEGSEFLKLCHEYLALEEKMRNIGNRQQQSQQLRVSTRPSTGAYLLPPVYGRFAQLYPQIRLKLLNISSPDSIEAMNHGTLDLAFSTLYSSSDYVAVLPFLSEPMELICSPGSSLPVSVTPSQLSPKNEIYVFWSLELETWHHQVFGTEQTPWLRLDQLPQLPLFITSQDSWAIVPFSVARTLLASGAAERREVSFPIPDRKVNILYRKQSLDSPPVRLFLDCLRDVLEEQQFPGLLL